MVEGEQFLIQSPSPDWVRRKILLSDLRDSAVNLILKEGNTRTYVPPSAVIFNNTPHIKVRINTCYSHPLSEDSI
jgi:hypothetical protein